MTDPTAASPPPDAVPAGRANALASSSGRPAAQLTAAPVLPALPPHVSADLPGQPSLARRLWPWVLLLIVLAGGYELYRRIETPAPTAADTSAAGGRGGGAGTRPVPVLAMPARRADVFPVCLEGLLRIGRTALNTVTVHSRVDGQLESVSFHEGDFVHKGDILAEIDPRPVPGAARAGARTAGQGSGAARERESGSQALSGALRAGLGRQAAARHAAGDREPGRSRADERPGADRHRAFG